MKMKRILHGMLCLVLLALVASKLNAQVTFGSLEDPQSGALLQLKNIDGVAGGNSNSTKGMMLPRVNLTNITQLYPMFAVGYDKNQYDLQHAGLLVYNINETLVDGDGAGIYTWDGAKWGSIGLVVRTLSAPKNKIYLSEVNTSETVDLNVTPTDLDWEMVGISTLAISDPICKTDVPNNRLTFTRDENAPCVTKRYTFGLCNSTKTVNIDVSHIALSLNKTLFKVGEDGTTSSSTTVIAEGGDQDWVVVSYTSENLNWVKAPTNDGGKLSFQIGGTTREGSFTDVITVAHKNDLRLTRKITIEQNKAFIILPVFDYLVIKYKYNRTSGLTSNIDLDTATEFTNTGASQVDNKPLGYGFGIGPTGGQPSYSAYGKEFFFWGGDNRVSGYETVFGNMTLLSDKIFPVATSAGETINREFNVDMYCTWWAISDAEYAISNKIDINITLYRGGVMVQSGFDFNNVPDGVNVGQKVFEMDRKNMPVIARVHNPDGYKTLFTKMLRLEYDKEENTGVLVALPETTFSTASRENDIVYPKIKPDESKDEYSKRLDQYRKQKGMQ